MSPTACIARGALTVEFGQARSAPMEKEAEGGDGG